MDFEAAQRVAQLPSGKIINNFLRKRKPTVDKITETESVINFLKFPNIPVLSNKIISLFKGMDEAKLVLYNIRTTQHLYTRIKDSDDTKNKIQRCLSDILQGLWKE